jgi:hypothetical protein
MVKREFGARWRFLIPMDASTLVPPFQLFPILLWRAKCRRHH